VGDQPAARQHKHRRNGANNHASSWIRTHDPSAWTGEDNSCLRLRGHCDRPHNYTDMYLMQPCNSDDVCQLYVKLMLPPEQAFVCYFPFYYGPEAKHCQQKRLRFLWSADGGNTQAAREWPNQNRKVHDTCEVGRKSGSDSTSLLRPTWNNQAHPFIPLQLHTNLRVPESWFYTRKENPTFPPVSWEWCAVTI
jgi:hypothetical protein